MTSSPTVASQACDYDPDEPDPTDYVNLLQRSLALVQGRRHLSVVPASVDTPPTDSTKEGKP